MPTPLTITAVPAPAGSKLVAALLLPAGLTTPAGVTVAGGTVPGTTTVPTGAAAVYAGLTPNSVQPLEQEATLSVAALPDTAGTPYALRVVRVAAGTDLTSYAALATAYAAATEEVAYGQTDDMLGGYLLAGDWTASQVPAGDARSFALDFPAGDEPTAVTLTGLTVGGAVYDPGLPVAFADQGSGVWRVTFADPEAGRAYVGTVVATWADGTTSTFEWRFAGATGEISAYTTATALDELGGTHNVQAYADKDRDGDVAKILAAKQRAGASTDADIRNAWRARTHNAGVTYAAPDPATMDPDEAAFLSETAAGGILVRLYRGRGMDDQAQPGSENPQDGKMSGMWKDYERRLQAIASGHALIAHQTAAGITRATRVPVLPDRVNTDPDGNGLRPPYCLPRWGW